MIFKVFKTTKEKAVSAYPALVIWSDAHEIFSNWSTLDDQDKEDTLCYTIGWIIPKAKPGHVVIASSIVEGEPSVAHRMGSGTAIPKEMVIKIKRISL